MKREVRIEGSPFTRRRKVIQHTETPEEMTEGLHELVRWSKDPWEAQRPLIEWAAKALEQERAEHGPEHCFQAHEDAGWYLSEILSFARIVDFNIAKGDPRWAAFAGARFGEMWSEFQLKLAREEMFLIGKKAAEDRAAGGAATRRTSDAVRVAAWGRYFEQTGKKTEADRLAAEELGEGESTIRKARTAWEKAAHASD